MQFAATSYNAIQDRSGYDYLTPERSQFSREDGAEFDGQIVVEWAIFPSAGATWAARVTVSEEDVDSESTDETSDDYVIVLLI
jgi:hypothetical protein